MERSSIRSAETVRLAEEDQYKIIAKMTLLDMIKEVGVAFRSAPPNLVTTPTERSTLIDLCKTAADDLTEFKTEIDQRRLRNDHMMTICRKLDFIDGADNLTPHFEIGLHYAIKGAEWMKRHDEHNLSRLLEVKDEVRCYLAHRVLPAPAVGGFTLLERLVNFIPDAEYWIGHYDQMD